jgi:hypothetical protein
MTGWHIGCDFEVSSHMLVLPRRCRALPTRKYFYATCHGRRHVTPSPACAFIEFEAGHLGLQ